MSYIEFDDSSVTFGDSEAVILYNGTEIARFTIPLPNLGEKYRDSINSDSDSFSYNDIEYDIDINSSSVGTYITIESIEDSNDIEEFEILVDIPKENYENFFEEEFEEKDNLKITLYVPTLPFTGTTSAVLFDMVKDEKIIPLIVIDTIDKLNSYKADEMLDFKHFLDVSSIMDMLNREEREKVKLKRKDEKKEQGKMITKIPSPKNRFIPLNAKIDELKKIEVKSNIIPIFAWDEKANITDLISFMKRLVPSEYEDIALRVSYNRTFFDNIDKISELQVKYLILDLNTNFDVDKIQSYITKIKTYEFENIIYLGAQFNPEDISIKQDNTNFNVIANHNPLIVFERLIDKDAISNNLGYGDYCGFDRRTITEHQSGGRPTARVVLNSLDKSMKVLIRRGWDESDVTRDKYTDRITKLGYSHSMRQLLCDIQKGKLDKENNNLYMDAEIC
ncbi:MAG: hypothetical protein WA945_06895, partial [Arcobacteraceae bacterium]